MRTIYREGFVQQIREDEYRYITNKEENKNR